MGVPDLATLRKLRTLYAGAALDNPELMPIFERIDSDCMDAEAFASKDPIAIARRRREQIKAVEQERSSSRALEQV